MPRSEPSAQPLRATAPAHGVPPVLGSPAAGALARHARTTYPGVETPAPTGPLPDPTPLCCAMVQAAVEGLRGVRPLAQLTRWVSPEVYDLLQLRAELVQRAGRPTASRAGIRRIRLFRIGEEVAEASVVVDDGPRVRAVAVRLEGHRGRWRAVAMEIG
ncbi:Rv3235 family protein [Cellulomonas aerilata]|uniref:Rv3235 family protein n=1 Tax=Cellulomonas aerilata TaxID=515326 RepID=UPI0011BF3FBD|nr:Rv3235 family protein [Cellulomonas aerilata]